MAIESNDKSRQHATPRTDAFCKAKYDGASAAAYNGTPDQSPEDAYGDAVEFARQLERDLTEVTEVCDTEIRQRMKLEAAQSSTALAPVADWYSEHTEAEMRREYQSATDHDAPDHIRGESFEKWAEAEGYIRGDALRTMFAPSATMRTEGERIEDHSFMLELCHQLGAKDGENMHELLFAAIQDALVHRKCESDKNWLRAQRDTAEEKLISK